MRKVPFITGEFYHVYNRGVDKRVIFDDQSDVTRFLLGIIMSNNRAHAWQDLRDIQRKHPNLRTSNVRQVLSELENYEPLVEIIAYNLMPNHFHFVLSPTTDNGVSTFMQRLQNGYTKYFNQKNDRSGALLQGTFKSAYLDTDEKVKKLVAYVCLNHKIHDLKPGSITDDINSWQEYSTNNYSWCDPKNIKAFYKSNKDLVRDFKELIEIVKAERQELKSSLIAD